MAARAGWISVETASYLGGLVLGRRYRENVGTDEWSELQIGALINWVCGIAVFLAIARVGVFGLGYNDLQDMLAGRITGN